MTPTQPAADRPTREDIETLIEAAKQNLYAFDSVSLSNELNARYISADQRAEFAANYAQAERALALAKSLLKEHGFDE